MTTELLRKYQLWLGNPLEKGSKMILERDITCEIGGTINMESLHRDLDEYVASCHDKGSSNMFFDGILDEVTIIRMPGMVSPSLKQDFHLRLVSRSRRK